MQALGLSSSAFSAAAARQQKRAGSSRHGGVSTYCCGPKIVRSGAPRSGALDRSADGASRDRLPGVAASRGGDHGASHQAAMRFQVVAPRQLKDIEIGRQRIDFAYQQPEAFAATNRPEWLVRIKTDAGYAKAAGIELTLLDCTLSCAQAAAWMVLRR
ncbi:MAG: type IV toxin-antitoxin system AbiEi family antitoxin [Pirellulales bacterium]